MTNQVDLSQISIRLEDICKKVTKSISFIPSDVNISFTETFYAPTLSCLEDINKSYPLKIDNSLINEWDIFAYDESSQNFKALEGDLLFISSALIKIEETYRFNLTINPYFLTTIKKFRDTSEHHIRFNENVGEEQNKIFVECKKKAIMDNVSPHSIVFIDGPIIGGNISDPIIKMDDALREIDCIPVYFVKNSNSRLIIDNIPSLSQEFNSDFHWASHNLKESQRSPFFKYTDGHSHSKTKVFTYVKALAGFPARVEFYTKSFEKYENIMPQLMDLIEYLFIVQGDFENPQIRPIAIAEKYAKEGLKIINIPAQLQKLGFQPTINQVRFG